MELIVKFWCVFLSLNSLNTTSGMMSFGCKSAVVVGSRVFVLQPISLCTGDPKVPEIGAF